MKKKYKPKSKDLKHYEKLLGEKLFEDYEKFQESLYIIDGDDFTEAIRSYAMNWNEVRVLVDALEESHLDDCYRPDKKYHLPDTATRVPIPHKGIGNADAPIHGEKTRAEILARLTEIALLDFGDDPDEWRRWFKAFDEDDFFPPVR